MERSLLLAYVLWLLGGWIGLHHLYLDRPRQAFLWTCSGACFGFGWLRDFTRMSAYVEEANRSQRYIADQEYLAKTRTSGPPLYFSRIVAQYIFSAWGFTALSSVITLEFLPVPAAMLGYNLLGGVGAALGVHIVGSIGNQCGSLNKTLLGSLAGSLLNLLKNESNSWNLATVGAIVGFSYFQRFRQPRRPRRGAISSFKLYVVLMATWSVVFCSGIYWHGQVTSASGERVYIRDSINNLLNSDFFRDFNSTEFFENAYEFNWESASNNVGKAMDPSGERRAYRILGLQPGAEISAVKRAHKKIVLENHPDKVKGTPEEIAQAQERFIEAQAAYDLLVELYKRKKDSNYGRDEL